MSTTLDAADPSRKDRAAADAPHKRWMVTVNGTDLALTPVTAEGVARGPSVVLKREQ